MKHKPVLALSISLLFAGLIVFGALLIEKNHVKENKLEKANGQVRAILENETDFDSIVEYVEGDPERKRFLGISLVELAKNEEKYVLNFEERYPRYKAYRDMVKELSRDDYSEWVASVIGGDVETEFEANVFEYLSALKDDRYLDPAVKRFGSILETTGDGGFVFDTNKDAFIVGALGLYIVQFPVNTTQIAKTLVGQKIGSFIDLSEELTADIKGIPLNKLYLYLYIKYFGLQEFIDKKMESFMAKAKININAQGSQRQWYMNVVDDLIRDLSAAGKGISQNYYSMFRIGIETDDAIYIYIALQILKNIGFDDPSLHNWLNRNYSGMEGRLTVTSERSITRTILLADEIREVRNAIKGKSDIPFEETLKAAVDASAKSGNIIVPRVSAEEEARKEIQNNNTQYTQDFVSRALVTWELKHQLLLLVGLVCLLSALICSFTAFLYPYWRDDAPDSFLSWLVLPLAALVLFFGFWNSYDNLNGFQAKPLAVFLVIGGMAFIIVMKTKMLKTPGRALWQTFLCAGASFNYRVKRYEVSDFYYDAAHLPLEKRVNSFIKKNDSARTLELLRNNSDANLSMRVINANPAFFASVKLDEMEKLFKDRLSWIDWLKAAKHGEALEKIRLSINEILKAEIPPALVMDDKAYSDFIADFTAFDYTTSENREATGSIISHTMTMRCNARNRTMPEAVIKVIDRIEPEINPSLLLSLAQEGGGSRDWLWKKIEKDSQTCKDPDGWFAGLVIPLEPEKFQPAIKIGSFLKLIDSGFSRCSRYFPALILLMQAREYIEAHKRDYGNYNNAAEYNGILERYSGKIEEAKEQAKEMHNGR